MEHLSLSLSLSRLSVVPVLTCILDVLARGSGRSALLTARARWHRDDVLSSLPVSCVLLLVLGATHSFPGSISLANHLIIRK